MAYAQERYLELLSQLFPTPEETAMEIVAEREQLGFPKPAELYISDVHGEYEEFSHILKNGSGLVRKRIDSLFSKTMSENERACLATLAYYPEQAAESLGDDELRAGLINLSKLCAFLAKEHPTEKVRYSCPKPFAPIVEKLLAASENETRMELLLDAAFDTVTAQDLACALATTAQSLAVPTPTSSWTR